MNVTIFEKRGGKNHKVLNIKNINLIKPCLKFFSGSLLPSGENSKLVNMTWGPSHLVPIYWSRLTSFSLLRPQHSFPRASCSLTPFHAAPPLLLFSLKIEPRVQGLQEAFSASNQLGELYFLCILFKAPWASQYHSVFHTVYLVEIVEDYLFTYLSSIYFWFLLPRDDPYSFLHLLRLTQHLAHTSTQ